MKGIACALRSMKNEMIVVIKKIKIFYKKSVDILSVKIYYKLRLKLRGLNMTTEEKIKAYLDEKKLQGGRK